MMFSNTGSELTRIDFQYIATLKHTHKRFLLFGDLISQYRSFAANWFNKGEEPFEGFSNLDFRGKELHFLKLSEWRKFFANMKKIFFGR